jgi:hypothetical protein
MIARLVLQRIDKCIEITRRGGNDKNKNNNDLSTDLHWDLTLQTLLVLVLVLIIFSNSCSSKKHRTTNKYGQSHNQ